MMAKPQQNPQVSNSIERPTRRPTSIPSWAISAALHLLLIFALGLTLQLAPTSGASTERATEVGIVLKHQRNEESYYQGAEDAATGDASAQSAAAGNIGELLSDGPPSDPSRDLPAPLGVIGPGALEEGGVGNAVGATAGPPGDTRAVGGKARTGIFGVQGEGYKFIYVFDRSESMGGSGRDLLGAAKSQLAASLESLEETHQFQIIFFNDHLLKFNPTGDQQRLVWANEQNKRLAEKFLGSVTAAGSTHREIALKAAINLQLDIIFFLTDADGPMGPAAMERITRAVGGVTIHTIEFGVGSQVDTNNFLVRLARRTGGKHGYIDVTRLFRPGQP